MSSHQKRQSELSVDEAAGALGVSSRMLRIYIDEKKIKALKVGRKWFVDAASVELFKKNLFPQLETSREEEKSDGAPRFSLKNLACYRLSLEGFLLPFFQDTSFSISKRCLELKIETLEALGAGYYSFGQQKALSYQSARRCVGAILGLIQSEPGAVQIHGETLEFFEKKLLPAFSSLIKKIERSRNFERVRHEPRPTHYF